MKAMKWLIAVPLVLAIWGRTAAQDATLALGEGIAGLASPVKLGFDSTTIHLLDYFQYADAVDSVYFDPPLAFDYEPSEALIRVFAPSEAVPPVVTLHVSYDDTLYHIPTFKSEKERYRFSYRSESEPNEVGVKANFNGWNHKATLLEEEDGVWSTYLILDPGLYEYLIVEDGREMLDPTNPDRKSNGMGGFNSTFRVGGSDERPIITGESVTADSVFVYYPARMITPLILLDNHEISRTSWSRNGDRLSVALPAFEPANHRSFIRVFGADSSLRSNEILLPLEAGKPLTDPRLLTRHDMHGQSMYFLMVDRFVNGDAANDEKVDDPDILPPANYYGGDLQGVIDKIESGYFDRLGTGVIWLSPIAQNPRGAYGLWDKGGVVSKFSGYHGYWPVSSSQVDYRFGTASTLDRLIDAAHDRGGNVILDYVANHVHREHPVYQQHPDWATDLYLPDGSLNTERWDEYRLTTWFDTFMPTLELRNPEVASVMTDSALFWLQRFALDGFRHDATKHIPLGFWRELTRKIKYEVEVPQNRPIYQIGETYGSPELIDSYIGSGLLDAQFDFNLYDAAVGAFAKDHGDVQNLDRVLRQSLETYGAHHLMGNISGNQDRTRFISYADGSVSFSEDPKLAGWTRDIEISDTIGYDRLALLHAFNFTVPGIPVIYYGDEIGMPGANDPDNRRMMRFDDDLNQRERAMLDLVSRLSHLRNDRLALTFGDTEVLHRDQDSWVYIRNYFGRTAIVAFNVSSQTKSVEFQIPSRYNVEGLNAEFGRSFEIQDRRVRVEMPPVSFEILTR